MGSSSKEGEVARRRRWATHVADEANLVMNRDHGAGGGWQFVEQTMANRARRSAEIDDPAGFP
jgi:hypothetical protein